jgi:hypothetical protein
MFWSERTVTKKFGAGTIRTWYASTDEASCVVTERDDGTYSLDAWHRQNQESLSGKPLIFSSLEQAQVAANRLMDYRPDQWERLLAEDLV